MDWQEIILNIAFNGAIIVAMPFVWAWKLLMEILSGARKAFVTIVGTAIAIYIITHLSGWMGH